jgi:hypothetical protein
MATAPIITRVPPEDRQKLTTPLEDTSTAALRAMGANRLMRPVMSPETEAELIAAGYGRQTLGGFTLTDVGMVRAMMENEQQ